MEHAKLFKKTGTSKTADGRTVEVLEFDCAAANALIPAWSAYIRKHYCTDPEIADGISGTGLTRQQFLKAHKIPSRGTTISAEFAEMLISDYIEFCLGYEIPRVRYLWKIRPNAVVQGTDIVGIKPGAKPPQDELITCETKAALVKKNRSTLKSAMKDAGEKDTAADPMRLNDTLVATKGRLRLLGDAAAVLRVERYQDKLQRPYVHIVAAAAVHCDTTYHADIITAARCDEHTTQFKLILLKGPAMMTLARALYEASCA